MRSIWVGFDHREGGALAVCYDTMRRYMTKDIPIRGLILSDLQKRGLYTRPMEDRVVNGSKVMWDVLSEAPMATQHANARFLVPHLAQKGWALFCDGDMMFLDDVSSLFDKLDPGKALYCVKHNYNPKGAVKMDGQVQSRYSRKNWTSFMFFNCDHSANRALTLDLINTVPGRDLHRLCWIQDDELIGELPREWNWLVGYSDIKLSPKCVHFTEGVPDMPGYENVVYGKQWREALENCFR